MQHWVCTGVGLFVLLGAAGGESAARGDPPAGWLTDYPTARAAARQAGKPLLVVFRCEP